jgi:hypothetical protein
MLHLFELRRFSLLERYSDKAVGALDVLADIFDRNVGQLLSFLVGDTIDEHGK